MSQDSSKLAYSDKKARRSRSENHRSHLHRTRSEEEADRRRESWLIQQEREREHERLKQKMILEYELKREAMLSSRDHSKSSNQNPSKNTILSQRLNFSDGKSPFSKGSMDSKITVSELRRIKVEIHRNIPGSSAENTELQRDIIDHEEVTLKRREGEGIKPIFDRDELKLTECSKAIEEVEQRIIKTIDTERLGKKTYSPNKRSMSLSPSGRRNTSSQKASLSPSLRYERSIRYSDRTSNHRSYSNEREKSARRSRNRETGRRDRLHDHTRHSSSHRLDRKDDSPKRRSSKVRPYSEDRKQRTSEHDFLTRNGHSHQEYREGSREHRKRHRSLESRGNKQSREKRVPTLPHYIEQVPVAICYGNFPPRPIVMGPMMMPIRGPLIRNRVPIGPTVPFSPRFIRPDMYRFSCTPNPRFNRMF